VSWLDTLYSRGLQARQREPAIVSAQPREEKPEIKSAWFETRRPVDGNDPGSIEYVYYSVHDGVLTMHDEDGKPAGKPYQLRNGEEPQCAASRLGRQAWQKIGDGDGFNRRLIYPPGAIT
jgi:hypothetical protein